MEKNANFLVIGIFVFLTFMGVVTFVLWFSKTNITEDFHVYHIYFEDVITNLEKGSQVHYRGLRVGEVTDIRLAHDNVELVRVTVNIQKNFPIKSDVVARLEMPGITGNVFIQLTGGTKKSRLLKAPPGHKYPVIPAKPSEFQAFLKNTPLLVEQTTQLISHLNHIFQPETRNALVETAVNIKNLTSELTNDAYGVPSTLREFNTLTKHINILTHKLNSQSHELSTLLSSANETTQIIKKIANHQLNDFFVTSSETLGKTGRELHQLLLRLNKIALELEKNPLGFLMNGNQKGLRLR